MARIDVVLLACLVPFALRGLWRGFVREVVSFAALGGGALLAVTRGPSIARALEASQGLQPETALLFAAGGLFLAVVIAGAVLGRLARRGVRAIFLGSVDRAAGAVLGLVQGVALVGLGCLGVLRLAPELPLAGEVDRSAVARPLVAFAERCVEVVWPKLVDAYRGRGI